MQMKTGRYGVEFVNLDALGFTAYNHGDFMPNRLYPNASGHGGDSRLRKSKSSALNIIISIIIWRFKNDNK